MTLDLKETYHRRARHEVAHALFCTHAGIEVESVSIHPRGVTNICYPWPPGALWTQYRAYPLHTLQRVENIAAMLLAPEIIHGQTTVGPDKDELHAWEHRWESARYLSRPTGPLWQDVLATARESVHRWADAVGRAQQLRALAEELLAEHTMSGWHWKQAVKRCTPPWLAL